MTDYEILKELIDEIPSLISANITSSNATFQAWKTKTERFIIHHFGKDSFEHTKFTKTRFSPMIYSLGASDSVFIEPCQEGLRTTQAILQIYLDEMKDDNSEKSSINPGNLSNNTEPSCYSKVFVVHGHDGELKESVARLIEKQGIEAVILSEQANQGKTIIEKFENYSDVGGAVCLFTADDKAKAKNGTTENCRARQNVVFETGYFIGRLGRDHIVILADHGVEMPSDLSGVVHTDTSNWKIDLLKELKAMGYKIDFNELF